MKKEVFVIVLALSIIFISSCDYYPGNYNLSPSGYIDQFDLGEDQTSHNSIHHPYDNLPFEVFSGYGCDVDMGIRMNCGNEGALQDYIQLKVNINPEKASSLFLQRLSKTRLMKFEWFINNISQGIVEDSNGGCEFLELEIPAQQSNQVTLKFKNVPDSYGKVSCSYDFMYVHLYVYPKGIVPRRTECASDSDCPEGYWCTNQFECDPISGEISCIPTTNPCPEGYWCNWNGPNADWKCYLNLGESECASDSDCPEGYFCSLFEGACIAEEIPETGCEHDFNCPYGYYCDNLWKDGLAPTYTCLFGGNPDDLYSCENDDYCQTALGINYFCIGGFCEEAEPEEVQMPDVSKAIDNFNLGEDQTTNNFACFTDSYWIDPDGEIVPSEPICDGIIYDGNCGNDYPLKMGCGIPQRLGWNNENINYSNQHIEFTIGVDSSTKNILALQRYNGGLGARKTTYMYWYINDEYQGKVEESGESCQLYFLEIPERYTQSDQIKLKFMNAPYNDGYISCGHDFRYVHAYMFREGDIPEDPTITPPTSMDNILLSIALEKDTYQTGEYLRLK